MPDIVLGDRYGVAAAPILTQLAELAFEHAGFQLARNAPYAGGYTTHLYGRRDRHVHALQIEINRALYLDEERIERGPTFACVKSRLRQALSALTEIDLDELGRATAAPVAAE